MTEWIPYTRDLWDRQPLPPERRYVLLRLQRDPREYPRFAIVVGYVKFSAGCEDSPYFVHPSAEGDVVAWCDCLPDELQQPGALWPRSV